RCCALSLCRSASARRWSSSSPLCGTGGASTFTSTTPRGASPWASSTSRSRGEGAMNRKQLERCHLLFTHRRLGREVLGLLSATGERLWRRDHCSFRPHIGVLRRCMLTAYL